MRGSLLQIFPQKRRAFWKQAAELEEKIQEIRLRTGCPVLLLMDSREWYLDQSGMLTDRLSEAYLAGCEEINEILQHICGYSVYAYEDELRQGFITVKGGHRVGIAGQAVVNEDGSLRTIKNISYMNIRIAHEIKGASDSVLPFIYREGRPLNVLIISGPGCGKTTLLRDLIRQISDGNAYGQGLNVGVVDERSEIAGSCMGSPQNDVGIRTDILDACPKEKGIMLLLRSMAPQVIAVDELGGEKDMEALHGAALCGCRLLATVHGEGLQDIKRKPGFRRIFQEQLFDCFVVLGRKEGRCLVLGIYGREEAYD